MITRDTSGGPPYADGTVVTAAVRDFGKFSLTSGNASAVRKKTANMMNGTFRIISIG